MHVFTTLSVIFIFGSLGILSEYPQILIGIGMDGYLPPGIYSQSVQVTGAVLFLSTFDYLVSSIVFDAAGHVECSEHARVLEALITLREENDALKMLLKESKNRTNNKKIGSHSKRRR
jgi:hypothetical protein